MLTELRTKTRRAISALIIGIGIVPGVSISDIYIWGSIVTDCTDSPDAADVSFTMVDVIGDLTINNGLERTPTCGSITYDTEGGSTGIGGGSLQIATFSFFSAPATAYFTTLEKIPAGLDDNVGNLLMANMLFFWNVTPGIPVSIIWDGQGILGEMDGVPTSFTLDADGFINTANAFSNSGGIPASDALVTTPLGPQPMATTTYNTTNVPACMVPDPGADGIPGTPDDLTNCMNVNPSGDISQPIITDAIGGNPMQDGPFGLFNANFEFNNLKLTSFTDNTPPVLALNGTQGSVINLAQGGTYVEDSASCTDAAPLNTDLNASVFIGGDVIPDPLTFAGSPFTVTYDCADPSTNDATQITRTINVKDPDAPIITLQGTSPVAHECATVYSDAGATCTDLQDGDISLPFSGSQDFSLDDTTNLDVSLPVSQFVTWSCTDLDSKNSTQDRSVDVEDTTNPVVGSYTLPGSGFINGSGVLILEVNDQPSFSNPTATATDTCDVLVTSATTTSTVNFIIQQGSNVTNSSLLYTVPDTSGNTGTDTLNVEVYRSEPVITLVGQETLVLNAGDTYIEQGADIFDAQDGSISGVTTSGTVTPTISGTNPASPRDMTFTIDSSTVDTSINGSYEVTYDVTDFDGNDAGQVIRTVQVGVFADNSNFTMLEASGKTFGGTNDVVFEWDETLNTSESETNFNMEISTATPTPFNGAVWIAHDIRVFGPGTYYIETDNSVCTVTVLQSTGCPGTAGSPTSMKMVVETGQVGAHILFDWNGVPNIDVVNVWDQNALWDDFGDTPPRNTLFLGPGGLPPSVIDPWKLMSTSQFTDANGPVHGSPMIDGPFVGFYANFNAGPGGVGEALPPITSEAPDTSLGASSISIWTMLTGLFSLLGLRIARWKMKLSK